VYCSKCGTALAEGAAYCSVCGAPVAAATPAPNAAPDSSEPTQTLPEFSVPAIRAAAAYAGFWLRLVAFVIDLIILFLLFTFIVGFTAVSMGLTAALQQIQPGESPEALKAALGAGFMLAMLLIVLAGSASYFSSLEASAWQATLGKKALGLYVTDLAGNRISFGRSSVRFFAGKFIAIGVPGLGILYFGLSCVFAGFTPKKQALHDMISGCLVMRKL
jgi:uncharacterized RDD family membrane protein YckC